MDGVQKRTAFIMNDKKFMFVSIDRELLTGKKERGGMPQTSGMNATKKHSFPSVIVLLGSGGV